MKKRILLAFQFCTIVPLTVAGKVTEEDVGASAAFFPLVGAFQGIAVALPAFLLVKVLPVDIAAALALVCLILTNGGFDLDGLADTFDAIAVKSSGNTEQDRMKRLAVMRDSRTGAIGVIALVMTLLLKFLLMRTLMTGFYVPTACAVIFLTPLFSKWITVPGMYHGASARNDGLGKIFIEYAAPKTLFISIALLAALSVLVSSLDLIGTSFMSGMGLCVILFLTAYLFCILAIRFLSRRFGGLTGDHFGALTETSEILFLLAGYVWLRHSTS
ncbi:MAG TPA: adenosylcobinamide-GDP ribazoletransferase [Syntrophorhabdales bacterium]|nr:adenosylcobinamide-GDP ribazoletransferase [Syntrophorhabdales bacterium]